MIRVAKSESDTGLVDNLCQVPGTQFREGVYGHCPRLGNREPATHHGRIVGGANQHPVARFEAESSQSVRARRFVQSRTCR